jgi:guanylate kinase
MKLGPRKAMVFIVSAPSGGGKTTLVNEVISAFPGEIYRVVTCTTREPRKGEVQGKDYFFLTEEEFEKKSRNNEFLESTRTYDHAYGILKSSIEDLRKKGNVFLVIDVKGAVTVMKSIETISIFVQPPSMHELERRIRNRMQDDEKELEKRLCLANEELEKASLYDYNLVNDDFSVAVETIKSIIIAESFRRS